MFADVVCVSKIKLTDPGTESVGRIGPTGTALVKGHWFTLILVKFLLYSCRQYWMLLRKIMS